MCPWEDTSPPPHPPRLMMIPSSFHPGCFTLLLPHRAPPAGGVCVLAADGFYTVCWASLGLGLGLGLLYWRYLPRLMSLPIRVWRAGGNASMPGAAAGKGGKE